MLLWMCLRNEGLAAEDKWRIVEAELRATEKV
jgi:hypothetical protein